MPMTGANDSKRLADDHARTELRSQHTRRRFGQQFEQIAHQHKGERDE